MKNILKLIALLHLLSCSGHHFFESSSTNAVDDNQDATPLEVDQPFPSETVDGEDDAPGTRVEAQRSNGNNKPSDGNEDIGYVKPEIEPNGDLRFETNGLHDKVDIKGLLLAGTYPPDVTIQVNLLSDDKGAPSVPPSHPVVEVTFSNNGQPATFSANYHIEVIDRSNEPSSALVVRYQGRTIPIPGLVGEHRFQLNEPSFSTWFTQSKQHPGTSFQPIAFSLVYEAQANRLKYDGSFKDGRYESYVLNIFPAEPSGDYCFSSSVIATLVVQANLISPDRIAYLPIPDSYKPQLGHKAVACPIFQGVTSAIHSEVVGLEVVN